MSNVTTCESAVKYGSKETPTTSSFINALVFKANEFLQHRRQRKIDRDAFRSLMSLDERSLKDIGVSKDDIIWASKLAMQENASKELEKIRAQNIATARLQATRKIARR